MLGSSLMGDPILLKKLSIIEKVLNRELERYKESPFYESLIYALKDGKRLRPLLLLICSEIYGEPKKEPYSALTIVELIHTVSLVHDDMIDKEVYRRGKMSYHLVYGEEQALLLADFVLSIILELSMRYSNTEIPFLIANTVMRMSESQLLETRLRTKDSISWEEYFKIIDGKTASLFELSARIGAILATENPFHIEAISEYGRNLGLSYQMYDDLRDWEKKEYVQKLSVENKQEFLKTKIKHHSSLSQRALESLPNSISKTLLEKFLDVVLRV